MTNAGLCDCGGPEKPALYCPRGVGCPGMRVCTLGAYLNPRSRSLSQLCEQGDDVAVCSIAIGAQLYGDGTMRKRRRNDVLSLV